MTTNRMQSWYKASTLPPAVSQTNRCLSADCSSRNWETSRKCLALDSRYSSIFIVWVLQGLIFWKKYYVANLHAPLDVLEDTEKEAFILTKINSIVTRRGTNELNAYRHFSVIKNAVIDAGTDEISTDEKVRNASRSFRQTFKVPATERLVNCKIHMAATM